MNAAAESDTYSLELTHTFSAPRDEVSAAWTQAEQLVQWFGSQGSKTTHAEVDLRVGGGYRMERAAGQPFPPVCAGKGHRRHQ